MESCDVYLKMLPNEIDVEEFNKQTCKVIRAAEEAIVKKKTGNRNRVVPWWKEECSKAVSMRKKALRKVSRFSITELINYKRAQAVVGHVIRTAKRKYWREFCENIGENIEINIVFD